MPVCMESGAAGGLVGGAACVGLGLTGVGLVVCGVVLVGLGTGAGGDYVAPLGEVLGEVVYESQR
jgi:hypothetical protein